MELSEKELDEVLGGVPYEGVTKKIPNIETSSNEELSFDELKNAKAGYPYEHAINDALNNKDLYRKEHIEKLKQQKEVIENFKEKQDNQYEEEHRTITK